MVGGRPNLVSAPGSESKSESQSKSLREPERARERPEPELDNFVVVKLNKMKIIIMHVYNHYECTQSDYLLKHHKLLQILLNF